MNLREDEAIAIEPVRVLGVEGHEFVPENMGNRCHAHRRTWVAGVGFEGGIDLIVKYSVSFTVHFRAVLNQVEQFRLRYARPHEELSNRANIQPGYG